MAFFEGLKEKAADLGRAGVAKSKQLAEITKLSLCNASEEDEIKKAYIEIGRLYYAERGMAPETAYAALCEKITAAKAAIEENKSRIAQLKAAGKISDSDMPEAGARTGTAEEAHAEDAPAQENPAAENAGDAAQE